MGEKLGQHFLHDKKVLDDIVDQADPHAGEIIVEIGPGTGVLTERLLPFVPKLIAIEKDAQLVSLLKKKFTEEINSGVLNIYEKDIRDFDPAVLCGYDLPYSVAANIPYYITGEILRRFLTSECQPQLMTLLLQNEVVQRIIAKDSKESVLSISVKAYGTPHYVRKVPASSFSPPPNVDSALLTVDDISKDFFKNFSEEAFFAVVKAGFAHKRKKLLNNLGTLVEPQGALQTLHKYGLNENTRAEELSVGVWKELAESSIRS